jgi:hypothetical protein
MAKTNNKIEENRHRKGFLHKAFSFLLPGSPVPDEEKTEEKYKVLIERFPVIDFFTYKNEFAVQLALLAEVVPEHDGAIRAKQRWSTAEPFSVTSSNPCAVLNRQSETEEITDDQLQEVEDWICNVNLESETLRDITRKVIIDLETTGNAYIELIRGDVSGQPFFFLEHHDATTALLIRRESGVTVGLSPDWMRVDKRAFDKIEVVELPLYRGRFTQWVEFDGTERCIMHLKQYRTGRHWYGLPESISSLLAQKIDFETNRHNLDRLETDFFPRLFFEFFNTDGMSEEKQAEHLEALMDTFTKQGGDRFGIFAQYNETEESNTKVHQLEMNNSTGEFIPLRKDAGQQILTAHATHPIIAGIQTPGSLGSSKEVREIFELFNSTVIVPLQNFLTEKFINPVMMEAGTWTETMDGLYLKMNTSTPVSFMGSIDVNRILTVNEGREQVGYGELTDNVNGEQVRDERGDRIINDKANEQDINQ